MSRRMKDLAVKISVSLPQKHTFALDALCIEWHTTRSGALQRLIEHASGVPAPTRPEVPELSREITRLARVHQRSAAILVRAGDLVDALKK